MKKSRRLTKKQIYTAIENLFDSVYDSEDRYIVKQFMKDTNIMDPNCRNTTPKMVLNNTEDGLEVYFGNVMFKISISEFRRCS